MIFLRKNWIIFWIVSMPLLGRVGYFEGIKVLYFWLGSIILAIDWIFLKVKKLNKVIVLNDYFFWFWILFLLISSIFGIHPLDSIVGGSYRHQGVIFFILIWLIGKSFTLFNKRQKKLFVKLITITVFCETVLLLIQSLSGKGLVFSRPLGSFGEANAVAGFLLVSSFFVYKYAKHLLFIPFIGIVLTQSRSAIIAFFILIISSFKISGKIKVLLTLALVIFVLILGSLRYKSNVDYKPEDRNEILTVAITSIKQKPFLGYGAESGEAVYNMYYASRGLVLENLIIDRTHNIFLDVLVWSGAFGLLFFLFYLFFCLREFYQLKQMNKIFAVVSFLFFASFQPLGVVHWILFFVLINW